MRIKHLIATTVLVAATLITASAQDRISLRDGSTIKVKVKEVSPKTVKYKKWDNQDGPDFIINKNEIEAIKYANGSEDVINDGDNNMDDNDDRRDRYDRRERYDRRDRPRRSMGLSNEKYGKNILSLAPVQMANESPAGIGLQYERVLDRRNIISLVLPVAVVFDRSNNDYYNGNYYNNRSTRAYTYFYPGFKIYPTGSNRIVSYGVGVAAALGFGRKTYSYYNGYNNVYEDNDVFKAGILVNNSLNIQPMKKLYIGLELGLGFAYYNGENNNKNYYNYSSVDDEPMVQFSFKIGYRF